MTSSALRFTLLITTVCLCAGREESEAARRIAVSSGLPGGICVLLGGTEADLGIALSKEGRFVIQALYPDPADLQKARSAIKAAGVYGTVSADRIEGARLPYAENLINLVVVDKHPDGAAKDIPLDELFRVLAPLGSVFVGDSRSSAGKNAPWIGALQGKLTACGFAKIEVLTGAGTWVKAVKPWPRDIDEWTHYLHGADGNPVAQDQVVGPPARAQWVSDPPWLRSHESDSSVKTMVTARGRLFTIEDEAPLSLLGEHRHLPDKWFLKARDAFNGTLLWKVPIKDWGWRAWKTSWFSPRPGDIPLNIEKRLVAIGDRLYVTLGYKAPVSELDAKTGRTLQTYEKTDRTAEILHHDGRLILTVLEGDRARVVCVDAQSGKRLWASPKDYAGTKTDYYKWRAMGGSVPPAKVDPTLNTATDGNVIALLDGENVACLDYATGKELWTTTFPAAEADRKAGGINAQRNVWVGTLIVQDGMIIHASPNRLAGFSAESGKVVWTQDKKYLGHLWYSWQDVFIIDGLVWTWSAELVREKLDGKTQKAKGVSSWPASVNGYNLKTGKLARKVSLGRIFKTHHHHRCYRNKATVRYILASRRGTEYVDLKEGQHTVHNWVRGTCHMGMMPANGLQYAPPHPCRCYIEEKLYGMYALAPAGPAEEQREATLEQGPAFGKADGPPAGPDEWPTFRHDPIRSGSVKTPVPSTLRLLWRKKVGKKIAPAVAVGGRLFVPQIDEHHVASLDASDGSPLWDHAAGGRIDSPPTYHKGKVLFGSSDGRVTCLRAADGVLVWRFHAAPTERRIGAFGQLESAWPVHGSVLVLDETASFAAGRSSHLDGGLILYGIDASSGELRSKTRLEGPHYGVADITQNYHLPMGFLADILQSDGTFIYMGKHTLNTKLKKQKPPQAATARVEAMGGFLDDSYFKRAHWTFPVPDSYARLIVHDERAAYCIRMFDSLQGLSPKVYFTPGKKGYLLFAVDVKSRKRTWSRRFPVRVKAMVAAGGILFTAGPPDVVDPEDPLGAFEGRKGGVISALDGADGKVLWEEKLPSPPVFNGMAAASGRLYVAMEDGSVACFGK